jgi:integrase
MSSKPGAGQLPQCLLNIGRKRRTAKFSLPLAHCLVLTGARGRNIKKKATPASSRASEHLTFLVTETGKPYGDNHFSESFREWCDAAGLPKRCSAHGLRKARCRWLAEHGCSGNEIMSNSGHATMKELVRYTKAADQARLARNALARTADTTARRGIA